MSRQGDDRSQGTTPPPWWLKAFGEEHERRTKANTEAKKRGEPAPHVVDTVGLGRLLATIVGRKSGPWDHSAVSNFLNGIRYTREMAEAFSHLYQIPRFEFLLRIESKEKATEIEMVLARADALPQPIVAARLAEVDQLAAALQESAEDQIAPVRSSNEGTNRGRRAGRTARRS